MNQKGFTLVELLAVIVLLGIVASITIAVSVSSFQKSKEKTEEIFKANMIKAVEMYIPQANLKFETTSISYKKYDETEDKCSGDSCNVDVYSDKFNFNKIITDGIITEKEVKNPNKEKATCYNDNTVVNVYRDSDKVYCFTLKLDCLNEEINTCPLDLTKELKKL